MAMRHDEARGIDRSRAGRVLVLAAFAAFLIANLIHNRFGVDAAIVPATVFVAVWLWRPRRWIQLVALFFIAAPSLLFFKVAALTGPAGTITFWNHVVLLVAAVLAIAGAIVALRAALRH